MLGITLTVENIVFEPEKKKTHVTRALTTPLYVTGASVPGTDLDVHSDHRRQRLSRAQTCVVINYTIDSLSIGHICHWVCS
jgi:hypothetical protein